MLLPRSKSRCSMSRCLSRPVLKVPWVGHAVLGNMYVKYRRRLMWRPLGPLGHWGLSHSLWLQPPNQECVTVYAYTEVDGVVQADMSNLVFVWPVFTNRWDVHVWCSISHGVVWVFHVFANQSKSLHVSRDFRSLEQIIKAGELHTTNYHGWFSNKILQTTFFQMLFIERWYITVDSNPIEICSQMFNCQ